VAEVEWSLRRAGSESFIFSTLLCSGSRTANFIALPGERRVQTGELVQLDCGPSLEGYHGDFSRVVSIGSPGREAEYLMETTALMYENCLENLRPGVSASAVATEVLGVAARRGFGPENLYQSPNVKPGFVGHGIGLANPDIPQLSPEDHTEIAEAMVINIETMLRIPEKLGARIEDAVVVGKDSTSRLSKVPIRLWEKQKC
jgi:Xaa-Pro aminopeptidase